MPTKSTESKPFVLADALLAAYDTNESINRYLIENLSEEAWRAEHPTAKDGRLPRWSPTCITSA